MTRTPDQITAHLRLPGGQHHTLALPLPKTAWELRQTPPATVTEIDQLLDHHTHAEIADILNQRGLTSGDDRPFHALSSATSETTTSYPAASNACAPPD